MNIVFLPVRSGSKRVPNKNTKNFHDGKSLLDIKVAQLVQLNFIDEIIISTDSKEILDSDWPEKVRVVIRNNDLCRDNTKTIDLIQHAIETFEFNNVIWTHVTSPFFSTVHYELAWKKFLNLVVHDSLVSVTPIRGYCSFNGSNLNYGDELDFWPATQELKPVFEINSACFIVSKSTAISWGNRIGNKPFLFECDEINGFDIDYSFDFMFGKFMLENGFAKV